MKSVLRILVPLAGAALVAGAPRDASADARAATPVDEPTWRLEYAAPSSCPTRDQVRSLVVARLGFDPFVEVDTSSTLRMTIDRVGAGPGLRVHVERLEDAKSVGERDLTDAQGNCGELVAAAAFAASLLVDPNGEMRKRQAPRSAPAPDPRPSHVDNPFTSESSAVVASPPPREPMHVRLGARVIGSAGLAPAPSFGGALEAGIAIRRFSIRVEGRADAPTESSLLADQTGAKSSLLLGSLVPCYAIGIARACAVGTAGAILAESVNVAPVEHDRAFFAAVGLRGGVEVPVAGPIHIAAHLDGLVPLRRLTIRTLGVDVWTVPPVAVSAGLGVVVRVF